AFTGDERSLEALSVAEVIDRPAFQSDVQQLREQLALPPAQAPRMAGSATLNEMPELQLTEVPGLSSIPRPLWENAIFFGDASASHGHGTPLQWDSAPTVHVVAPTSSSVSAADGWVDARSAFAVLPELSQGLGGVITTNSRVPLSIDPAQWTLASVAGALEDIDGKVVSGATRGYRWLPPVNASALRCVGLCVVVAQANHPYETSAPPRSACMHALTFWLPLSWLAVSELPPSPLCLLRYNVRFDPHWIAFMTGTRLAHIAIDSTANGWIVQSHDATEQLVIVEWVAGLQFAAEVLSIALLIVICAFQLHISLRLARRS
ncbi:MAG: hypothetical protein JO092_05845, partial [Candidatus Eremiobacteraeota bacterium]|nr:hypothetical protein [Candidatus Eremiobacteraeota bacterium]